MAEIEYFCDPAEKDHHPKFDAVADLDVALFSACNQMDGKGPELMKLKHAVETVRKAYTGCFKRNLVRLLVTRFKARNCIAISEPGPQEPYRDFEMSRREGFSCAYVYIAIFHCNVKVHGNSKYLAQCFKL
jgi:hypothetical protein